MYQKKDREKEKEKESERENNEVVIVDHTSNKKKKVAEGTFLIQSWHEDLITTFVWGLNPSLGLCPTIEMLRTFKCVCKGWNEMASTKHFSKNFTEAARHALFTVESRFFAKHVPQSFGGFFEY